MLPKSVRGGGLEVSDVALFTSKGWNATTRWSWTLRDVWLSHLSC